MRALVLVAALAATVSAAASAATPAMAADDVAVAAGDHAAPSQAARNAALVRAAFADWAAGRGSVFDLLAEDVTWTVAGSGPATGTYRSREDFMARSVRPIAARLATPIVPTVEHVMAEGDEVVVFWRGTATTRAGGRYANDYAWRMTLRDGRIVRATAYLDTRALADLMR